MSLSQLPWNLSPAASSLMLQRLAAASFASATALRVCNYLSRSSFSCFRTRRLSLARCRRTCARSELYLTASRRSRSRRMRPRLSSISICVLRRHPRPRRHRILRPQRLVRRRRSTLRVRSACCRTLWTMCLRRACGFTRARGIAWAGARRDAAEHPSRCHGGAVAQGVRAGGGCY